MEALDRFARLYEHDPLPEFYRVVDALFALGAGDLQLPSLGRWSNGRLEGTNNKLGVLKRTAYGFTNSLNFEARGLLLCPPRRMV